MALYNKSRLVGYCYLMVWAISSPTRTISFRSLKNYCLTLCFSLLLSGVTAVFARQAEVTSLPASAAKGNIQINLQTNRLSIEAKQVSWQELLAKLEEKTSIDILGVIPTDSTVTVSIPSLPVTEALQRLFSHRFDFVLLYPEPNTRQSAITKAIPKTVWLFGNAMANATQSDKHVSKANGKPISGLKPDKPPVSNEPAGGNSKHETIQELIDKARKDENPEARLQALASLSGQEQPDKTAAKLALETALEDKDSRVREYALQALAQQDGQEATEYLREALNDPDPGVRMRAIESVGLEGQGLALLHEALSNPDELVKTIAEERFKAG